MNSKRKLFITLFLGLIAIFALGISQISASKNNIDNTRDYNYEHYCDSIYENNPDYYLDVLVETDKYQNYLEEHGQWWKN